MLIFKKRKKKHQSRVRHSYKLFLSISSIFLSPPDDHRNPPRSREDVPYWLFTLSFKNYVNQALSKPKRRVVLLGFSSGRSGEREPLRAPATTVGWHESCRDSPYIYWSLYSARLLLLFHTPAFGCLNCLRTRPSRQLHRFPPMRMHEDGLLVLRFD